jgi:hypothetical protein
MRPSRQWRNDRGLGPTSGRGSRPGLLTPLHAGYGGCMIDRSRSTSRCPIGFARQEGVICCGPLSRGSVELTGDYQHLARLTKRIGVPDRPVDRFRDVTDEVAVCRHPHLTGPAAPTQPTRADRTASRGIRLVLNEQLAPSVGDGLDVLTRRRCRQDRRPPGHLLDRRQSLQHCSPHPTIHLLTSLPPPETPRAHLPHLTTRSKRRHAAVHCLPDFACGLKPPQAGVLVVGVGRVIDHSDPATVR